MVKIDLSKLIVSDQHTIENTYEKELIKIKDKLINKTGAGSNFTGWVQWPTEDFKQGDLIKIKSVNEQWKKMHIDTVIVIGIGGSYLGGKAGVDMCTQTFADPSMNVIFISGLHSQYNCSLLAKLQHLNWAIVVISKSGTTFETAVNFRIFREALLAQYKTAHAERIVAITDKQKGVLKTLADHNHYQTLVIPDDIGGRYSTITSVGLLPMMLAGINIDAVLKGWTEMINQFKQQDLHKFSAGIYAATRHFLLTKHHKQIEIFCTYENNLKYVAEHYKQIFAESEGKTIPCVLPTIANNSEDLHSIGQLYQDGINNCFETSLVFNETSTLKIPASNFSNDDHLDYIANQTLTSLSHKIKEAVTAAHVNLAKIPNITISFQKPDAEHFGALAAWLAIAAATSSYLLNVNPFDQPGVEAYKNEMKKLIK